MTNDDTPRAVRLLLDPAIGGDLLLVAYAMDVQCEHDLSLDNPARYGPLLWPDLSPRRQVHRVTRVLRDDIRTYRPPPADTCVAPARRPSGTCGRSAVRRWHRTDWATGEQHSLGACSRHQAAAETQLRANLAAKPVDPPLPYANHGGLLRPYFPMVDWDEFWRQLEPRWRQHPERPVTRPTVPAPEPTLRLVVGDGTGSAAPARPVLAVVPLR